jgi:hypothetical protein
MKSEPPPIALTDASATPLPDVIEDNSEAAWREWDAAQRRLDINSPDWRAMRLADSARPLPLELVE